MNSDDFNGQKRLNLAERLREIREDFYGEHGAQFLADALEIPLRTWLNYESGVVMPAALAVKLLVLAHVHPRWLLTGEGEKYHRRPRQHEAGHGIA
jgi:hypothetical protein